MSLKNWMLGILFPLRCLGCGHYDYWICPTCCGRQLHLVVGDGIYALGYYTNPLLKQAIHQFKYQGYKGIGQTLGQYLTQVIPDDGYQLIVPVPLHWQRRLDRGFNQAAVLAAQFKQGYLPALKKSKATKRQATLNRTDRLKNLTNVFTVKKRYHSYLQDKVILLIDDVLSTGATTQACREALLQAGAKQVVVAVLAWNVPSCGIEPQLQDPQSCVLSVERRGLNHL